MKTLRQKKIMELVENQEISTQEELAEALKKAGFEVTQATISRDIKELRFVKIPTGNNTYRYGLPPERSNFPQNDERLKRMIQDSVVSLDYSENLVVLRTYPGNAQAVASLIDGAEWESVIGTVAGDDTILLVVKPLGQVENLIKKIRSLME